MGNGWKNYVLHMFERGKNDFNHMCMIVFFAKLVPVFKSTIFKKKKKLFSYSRELCKRETSELTFVYLESCCT